MHPDVFGCIGTRLENFGKFCPKNARNWNSGRDGLCERPPHTGGLRPPGPPRQQKKLPPSDGRPMAVRRPSEKPVSQTLIMKVTINFCWLSRLTVRTFSVDATENFLSAGRPNFFHPSDGCRTDVRRLPVRPSARSRKSTSSFD